MWQLEAACSEDQHDLFFSLAESKMEKAKAICQTCPVKSECLQFALDNDIEFGIYGGLSREERKVLYVISR